jgi:hypothetical protein
VAAYIHPQSPGYWYVRGEDEFGRYCKTTRIPILRRGKQIPIPPPSVAAWEADFLEQRQTKAATHGTHDKTAADAPLSLETLEFYFWQGKRAKRISADMERTYRNNWKQLRRHLLSFRDCETRGKLEEYVNKRKEDPAWGGKSKVTAPTISKELTVFYYAWRECVAEGVQLPAPPPKPRNLGMEEHEPHRGLQGTAYSATNLLKMHAAISKQHNKDKFWLCLTTGLRWWEIHRLHLVSEFHLNPCDGVAAIFWLPKEAAKKKRARWIGLSLAALDAWRRLSPFQFRSSRTAFDVARQRIGLPYVVTLRDLRKSFATGARENGANMGAIKSVMGHRRGVPGRYQGQTLVRVAKVVSAIDKWVSAGKFGRLSVDLENVVALRGRG